MTFVTYSPFDAIGTAAGLNLVEKINDALLHGSFLGVSILTVFSFLSLAKIAMDTIIEHKYTAAILEFTRLIIVILLFTVTTTATIFNMNIINFSYAHQASQNGKTTVGSYVGSLIYGNNNFDPSSAQTQMTNVPLMADIYVIPDNLAYQIANIMLNPSQNMTLDLASMVSDPRTILDAGLDSMVNSASDKSSIYKAFAKCYGNSDDYKAFSYISKADISCDQFNQNWANATQNIENQIKQKGNVDPQVLKDMDYMIYLLRQGTLQDDKDFGNKYLGPELKELHESAKAAEELGKSYSLSSTGTTGVGQSWWQRLSYNAAGAFQLFFSKGGQFFSHAATPKQFFELLMLHLQEYAIAIMFLFLPFVVIIGLLPIFGSNYKLIIKYATSFFLIKLWVPVVWFVYVSMVDVSAILMSSAVIIQHGIHFIGNGIEYAIATFTGNSAFAQTQTAAGDIANKTAAMVYVENANKFNDINNFIMAAMYVIVPAVLGSSATYLIGRGMVDASISSFHEGTRFMRSVGHTIMQIVGAIMALF